jgi:hypothetical protein
MAVMQSVVYILIKNGEYRCLSDLATSIGIKKMIKQEGWKHAATINAAVWLEMFLNGDERERFQQIEAISA